MSYKSVLGTGLPKTLGRGSFVGASRLGGTCLWNYTLVIYLAHMEAHRLNSRQDRVVRSIAAAGGRTCARPGCPAPARSTLTFAYDAKQARLVPLLPEVDPASYDLCGGHADRTSPPHGWTLSDERPPDPEGAPVDLADEGRTVAVISAALRAVPTERPDDPSAAPSTPEPEPEPRPAPEPPPPAAGPAREPRPVPAALDQGAPRRTGTDTRTSTVADVDDLRALTEAAAELAGAEVEVVLDELAQLDAVAAVPSATPTLFDAPIDAAQETAGVATLEADRDLLDDFDEVVDGASLSPEGHAQVW